MTSGVPNEIDVLVMGCGNTDFESKFVFECKNWKDPVGKEVVQLFSKVVDEVQATRGFLVAQSITKYAAEQLKSEPRLRYIQCSDDFVGPFSSIEIMHFVQDILSPTVTIRYRENIGRPTELLAFKAMECLLNGERIDFAGYVDKEVNEVSKVVGKENHYRIRYEGTHWVETGREIIYDAKEFVINGHEVQSIYIPFCCFFTSRKPKLVSKFELEGKGISYTFEPVESGDPKKPWEISVVATYKAGDPTNVPPTP